MFLTILIIKNQLYLISIEKLLFFKLFKFVLSIEKLLFLLNRLIKFR